MYERIKNLRVDFDYTQKKIADKLCVAQTTYSDYEHGKLNIPIPVLIRLALIYDTSIDYLLELTDDPQPYTRGKRYHKEKI